MDDPDLQSTPLSQDPRGGRRAHASALPATGAWRPGDPVADRKFLQINPGRPFALEGGDLLLEPTVAYETFGTLDADAGNAVLVCHALTGDAHVAGPAKPGQATAGWWSELIGPGKALDTGRYFVVCVNVLGSCQGTTGPASPHPDDGEPYGSRFPVVTVRDMVRTQAAVADELGVDRWLTIVGGSMGGMQALEWAVMYPHRVRSLVPIATCLAASAQQIGWWSTGRRIIRLDRNWRGGDYYDAADGDGPHDGLALARQISQITFRSDDVFTERFGRDVVEPEERFELWQRFEVERYLEYHGDKLVRRFDANSYLVLTKAMDLHDLARSRGGMQRAVHRIEAPLLSIGVSSDNLYPAYQSRQIAESVEEGGGRSRYVELESPHGHDAFLIEHAQLAPTLSGFLDEIQEETP
ncbi:MAG TPA: homoserine O-acetyltransferase [Acidimicrobiales bacterium]|nr:homoserine O-acetyltransferase [Acidimicrobiales bacterium]